MDAVIQEFEKKVATKSQQYKAQAYQLYHLFDKVIFFETIQLQDGEEQAQFSAGL